MIDYGEFTEYDEAYVILYCRAKMFGLTDEIMDGMLELAECGQINAMQFWATNCKDLRRSEYIKKKLIELDRKGCNEFEEALLMVACYDRSLKQKRKINDLVEYIAYLKSEQENVTGKDQVDLLKEIKTKCDALRDFESVHLRYKATERLYLWASVAKNPLLMERVLEEYHGSNAILLQSINLEKEIDWTKKELAKLQDSSKNWIRNKFAYAKHLYRFGDNEEHKKGREMMIELANRPLAVKQHQMIK